MDTPLPSTNPKDWHRLPGTAGRYRYRNTDITISRRQYDKHIGTLAEQGFSSYEQLAKLSKIEPIESVSKVFGFRSVAYPFEASDPVRAVNTAIEMLGVEGKRANVHIKVGDKWLSSKVSYAERGELDSFVAELADKYDILPGSSYEMELVTYD